jgi:hypothetical protein
MVSWAAPHFLVHLKWEFVIRLQRPSTSLLRECSGQPVNGAPIAAVRTSVAGSFSTASLIGPGSLLGFAAHLWMILASDRAAADLPVRIAHRSGQPRDDASHVIVLSPVELLCGPSPLDRLITMQIAQVDAHPGTLDAGIFTVVQPGPQSTATMATSTMSRATLKWKGPTPRLHDLANMDPFSRKSRAIPALVAATRAVPLRSSLIILSRTGCQVSNPTEPVGKELSGARARIPCRIRMTALSLITGKLQRAQFKGESSNANESSEVSQGTAEVFHCRSGRYSGLVVLGAGLEAIAAVAARVGLRYRAVPDDYTASVLIIKALDAFAVCSLNKSNVGLAPAVTRALPLPFTGRSEP